jgi:hypothetical protein
MDPQQEYAASAESKFLRSVGVGTPCQFASFLATPSENPYATGEQTLHLLGLFRIAIEEIAKLTPTLPEVVINEDGYFLKSCSLAAAAALDAAGFSRFSANGALNNLIALGAIEECGEPWWAGKRYRLRTSTAGRLLKLRAALGTFKPKGPPARLSEVVASSEHKNGFYLSFSASTGFTIASREMQQRLAREFLAELHDHLFEHAHVAVHAEVEYHCFSGGKVALDIPGDA